jgi:helicase
VGAAPTSNEVIGVLANSFAAHQMRLAGADDPFRPEQIASVLNEFRAQGFVTESTELGLTLTSLGDLVAQSGLSVQSAVRVASVLRSVQPTEINRSTLIAAAQLTSEVDQVIFPVNGRGWQKETQTFVGELRRQGIAASALNTLGSHLVDRAGLARRAKKAVACLLWMAGVPAAQLEATLMQHQRENDAIGPTRAIAARTRDVIGTVIDIAREIHPDADLEDLARLLPVQLELGIPREMVPLATHIAAELARHDYLRLADQSLTDQERILEADDETLLRCLSGDRPKLQLLRRAAMEARKTQQAPSLEQLLPAAQD